MQLKNTSKKIQTLMAADLSCDEQAFVNSIKAHTKNIDILICNINSSSVSRKEAIKE